MHVQFVVIRFQFHCCTILLTPFNEFHLNLNISAVDFVQLRAFAIRRTIALYRVHQSTGSSFCGVVVLI